MKKGFYIFWIILFFIGITIPLFYMNTSEITEQENRTLATFPPILKEDSLNYDFGKEFDSWLGDRFWGRDELIDARFQIMYKINGRVENDKVFVGDNGWMFYKLEGAAERFQNRTYFSEIELKKIADYLQSIHLWCEKHHKKFYFFIAPDKERIYSEFYFKDYIKINSDKNSQTIQLINYLKEHTDVQIVYNYDTLIANKDKGLLYYKNDTHWNYLGAYLAYQEYMNVIKKDFAITLPPVIKMGTIENPDGDLQKMIRQKIKDSTVYIIPEIENKAKCDSREYYNDEKPISCNSNNLYKVFFLRDSFTVAMGNYFSNTFGSVYYHWRAQITKDDLNFILNKNIDIVLLQIVERRIQILPDFYFPLKE